VEKILLSRVFTGNGFSNIKHGRDMADATQKTDRENIIARAIKMIDLVQYQEGAVVSRTVIDKKVGTVTVFSFDKGQGLSEHTAPYDAIVHIIDGEAEIAISGKSQDVQAGEMIIMPANQPHSLRANQRFKMVLTMIRA
jgi:quercetin dioxygenase-like cupin family protein